MLNFFICCQAICQNHPGCGHWSHYREGGDGEHYWGNCFLYTSCQLFTSAQCFGPTDKECRDVPYDPRSVQSTHNQDTITELL